MLSLGVLSGGFSGIVLYAWSQRPMPATPGYSPGAWQILSFFFMPAIMLVEAVMYWIVRNRIVRRSDARRHVLFFTLAYLSPFLKSLLFYFADNFFSMGNMATFVSRVNLVQMCLFWLVTIYAHVFFVRVLIKAFDRPVEVAGRTGESAHMLDDVLD
jgi:hypothetical protein